MRKPIYIILLLLSVSSTTTIFAQNDDHAPFFKDCEKNPSSLIEKSNCSVQALAQYIHNNLQIPNNVDVSGTVYIGFTIEKTGQITKIHLEKLLSPACDSAALAVVQNMSAWIPAQQDGQPIDFDIILPIKFRQADDSADSNGFQLTWGQLRGEKTSKEMLVQQLETPFTVRDESGNLLDINELLIERERRGKITEAKSSGNINNDLRTVIKKTKTGDALTVTATVQKKGKFYYVERRFTILEF